MCRYAARGIKQTHAHLTHFLTSKYEGIIINLYEYVVFKYNGLSRYEKRMVIPLSLIKNCSLIDLSEESRELYQIAPTLMAIFRKLKSHPNKHLCRAALPPVKKRLPGFH